jgi:hypothetical protein
MKIKKSNNKELAQTSKVPASDYLPKNEQADINQLKKGAAQCQGCSLYLTDIRPSNHLPAI